MYLCICMYVHVDMYMYVCTVHVRMYMYILHICIFIYTSEHPQKFCELRQTNAIALASLFIVNVYSWMTESSWVFNIDNSDVFKVL